MSNIVIGIHGLGNKTPRPVLQASWKKALYEGMRRAGHEWMPFRFRLVYWADLIYPEPLNPDETDRESPEYDDEPYVPSATVNTLKPDNGRAKMRDFINRQVMDIFLNDDMTLNFEAVTDMIVHRYFRELEIYFGAESSAGKARKRPLKDITRSLLIRALKRNRKDKILMIAHSMGSIIAYDVLTEDVQGTEADVFVTIGSPLGIPVVLSRIMSEQKQRLKRKRKPVVPESLRSKWYNFSDLDDSIAFNYRLGDDFTRNSEGMGIVDRVVVNDYAFEGLKNPHKSYGYLRTPEMGEVLHSFLQG